MKFTGERFIPTEQGKIRLEHYHRYAAVLGVISGKDVLDIACGEGYGSAMMSELTSSVVGVDISDEAVQHATKKYLSIENLSFLKGTATKIEFNDNSFDVVISFETIEHLEAQAEMLAEIRRVLRQDGVLIISSPNRPIYSEESGEPNEFHVKELNFEELDVLLKSIFPAVRYYGQRMMMGDVIQPLNYRAENYFAWHDDGVLIKPQSNCLSEPVYFLAVCGELESNLPFLNPTVLYPEQLDLLKQYVGFAKWAQSVHKEISELGVGIILIWLKHRIKNYINKALSIIKKI